MPTKTSGGLSPVKRGLDRMWAALEGRRMLDMTVLMIAGSTAVLTVLLSALSGPGEDTDAGARRGWSRPARRLSGGLSGMGWGRF